MLWFSSSNFKSFGYYSYSTWSTDGQIALCSVSWIQWFLFLYQPTSVALHPFKSGASAVSWLMSCLSLWFKVSYNNVNFQLNSPPQSCPSCFLSCIPFVSMKKLNLLQKQPNITILWTFSHKLCCLINVNFVCWIGKGGLRSNVVLLH